MRVVRRKKPGRSPALRQLLYSVLAGLALSWVAVWQINVHLDPMVLSVAQARFSNEMERLLCQTLEADRGDFAQLVRFEYAPDGTLAAVTTGCEAGNRLRSHITTAMLEGLSRLEEETVTVPVGSLSGLTALSGLGWEIPVRLIGVTNVDSGFDSGLTAAGINQTLHKITLTVRADLTLLLPGGPCTATVTTKVPLSETVLLGQVPQSYSYFSQFDTPQEAADAYNDWAAQ